MRDLLIGLYTMVGGAFTAVGVAMPVSDAIRGVDTTFCFTATSAGLAALAAGVAMLIQATRSRR